MPEEDPERRLLRLETDQHYIVEKLDDLAEKLEGWIKASSEARRSEHFSRKDVATLMLGAITSVAVIFGGFIYLVDSRVSPVKADVASQSVQINNRLDTFQESIRSIRDAAIELQKALGTTNVELSKDRKTLDTLERLDLGSLNAKQDSGIAENRRRIEQLEEADVKARDRMLDRAAKETR